MSEQEFIGKTVYCRDGTNGFKAFTIVETVETSCGTLFKLSNDKIVERRGAHVAESELFTARPASLSGPPV